MKRILWPLMSLFWLISIVIGYYYLHKPFTPFLALGVTKAVGNLTVVFLMTSLGGGIGGRLARKLELPPAPRLAFQAALGLGVLSPGVLLVGSTIGLKPLLGWILLVGLVIIFWRDILAWWLCWKDIYFFWKTSTRFGRLTGIGVGLILAFTLCVALAPPLKFDALVYHLVIPQAYMNAGRVVYVNQISMYWGMPQQTEMLYTWAMLLGGEAAATTMGWAIGVLALVGLIGYTAYRFSGRAAWGAAASIMVGSTLAVSLAWGYVDWPAMLFGWASLVALDLWRTENNPKMIAWVGVFAGLALGTKYTAGLFVLACAGVIFAFSLRSWCTLWRSALLFSSMVLVVWFPWWMKNTLAIGNPFYPLIFNAGRVDSVWRTAYQSWPIWGDWSDIFFLPLRATIMGIEGGAGYGVSIGPFLLGFGALAWLGWRSHLGKTGVSLLMAGLVAVQGLIFWSVGSQITGVLIQTRMYFPFFPAFVILAGVGFEGLSNLQMPGIRLRWVVSVFVLFVFGLNVLDTGISTLEKGAPQFLLGLQTADKYQDNNLGWYAPAMRAIRALPESSRVLVLWEPRSYHCSPLCVPDEILDRWKLDMNRYDGSVSAILQSWRAAGFTHVLFYRLGAEKMLQEDPTYSQNDWQVLDDLLNHLNPPTHFGDAYFLYTLP